MSISKHFDYQNIKLLGLDVDGVLTNGQIIHDANGVEQKAFSVKDGAGIKLLQKAGIEVIIITARSSNIVDTRAKELGIKKVYQGAKNKLGCLQEALADLQLTVDEVAYMGDDYPDLSVIKTVGLGACPADAADIILKNAKWRSSKPGGAGAVREFAEHILSQQNKLAMLLEEYGA